MEEFLREIRAQIPPHILEQRDPFKKPYYDGKDTELQEKPYCLGCRYQNMHYEIFERATKRCSRCNVAWYCSRQCQKNHFKHHRQLCNQIETDIQCVEFAADPLRNFVVPGEDNAVAENLLETRVGDFGSFDTQEYLQQHATLAKSYWDAAYDSEVKEVWEKSLFHYLEILRLDAKHRGEARFRVPYILLYLNRDDDAFAFIRYWLQFDDLDYGEVLSRHRRSRPGDWLYPIQHNCRYLDMLEECPKMEEQKVIEPYLMALVIIKMRIVASHAAVSRELDFVFQQTVGKRIQEVRSLVQEMLVGSDLANQNQQLGRLLDKTPSSIFDATNELMGDFPGAQSYEMDELTRRYPFPIDITLSCSLQSLFRVPKADDLLESFGVLHPFDE